MLQLGRVNSLNSAHDTSSVLMVPIYNLKKEHIYSIQNGNVSLNPNILNLKGLIAILPQDSKIDLEGYDITEQKYTPTTNVVHQLKTILGDDFVADE